jgi:hypothetical protein
VTSALLYEDSEDKNSDCDEELLGFYERGDSEGTDIYFTGV